MTNKTYIDHMNDYHTYRALLKNSSFRRGYTDGLFSLSFLMFPYRPKPIKVPTLEGAWDDVGAIISASLAEYKDLEKTQIQKTDAN